MKIVKTIIVAAAALSLVGFTSCKSKQVAPTQMPDSGSYDTGK